MLGNDLIKGAKGVEADTNGLISARQVYHMVEKGRLPVIRKGRAMYFRRSELEEAFRSDQDQ
ncbi:MAG: helix-turn-helix domain-containing protein [Pseudomonadota bacterium]